jgi:DNA repair exonuclease SbcCD nuclease subunit
MRTRLLENDFYERFQELFDKISELDPPVDLVIHSGDFYNSPWEGNPSQPPVVARETAIKVLKGFIERTGIPVMILEGNHGIYRSLEVSLLDSLKMAVPGLDVATQQELKNAITNGEPLVTSYDAVDVYCFPFMEYNVLESAGALEDYNDWITTYQKPSGNKPAVAVAHGMDLDRTLYPAIFSLNYNYIALGHDHHQRKQSKNAWYAGSPERWRFDEIKHDKGFLLIEIDNESTTVIPQHLEFKRPVYNHKMSIDDDDTVQTVIDKVNAWFEDNEMKAPWNQTTAARVRLVFDGLSSRVRPLDLGMAMESLRLNVLAQDSEYNISQLYWTTRQVSVEHDAHAYPEIESEYLIEDPESDFMSYLETIKLDEAFDPKTLTRIAVEALKSSVGRSDKMTYDTIMGDDDV